MKAVIVTVLCFAACVSAGLVAAPGILAAPGVVAAPSYLVRTPHLDSAVIKSDRLGGNFAYSTVEGHAYAAVSPVVQNVVRPVAVSYTAHQVPVGAVAYAAHQVPIGAVAYAAPLAHSKVIVA